MTPIRKPLKRLTAVQDPDRSGSPLVILIEEGGHMIRVKPRLRRQWYSVTMGQIWRLGVQNKANEIKAAKLKKREERKAARA